MYSITSHPDGTIPHRLYSDGQGSSTNCANIEADVEEAASGYMVERIAISASITPVEVELVTFKEKDPGKHQNWSRSHKSYGTMVVAFTCLYVRLEPAQQMADRDRFVLERCESLISGLFGADSW